MNWQNGKWCESPLLDSFGPHKFPGSFYTAFYIVFGNISEENQALDFLESINAAMEEEKGGGIVRKEEIITLRDEGYIDVTKFNGYNTHHVKPRSRDLRPKFKKTDQEVRLPERFHEAWHIIFLNLYDWETVLFLERIFHIAKKNGNSIDYCELHSLLESLKEGKVLGRV